MPKGLAPALIPAARPGHLIPGRRGAGRGAAGKGRLYRLLPLGRFLFLQLATAHGGTEALDRAPQIRTQGLEPFGAKEQHHDTRMTSNSVMPIPLIPIYYSRSSSLDYYKTLITGYFPHNRNGP